MYFRPIENGFVEDRETRYPLYKMSSSIVYTSECPMCQYPSPDFEALAHPKAMRTAHDLAMKKAEIPIVDFEKVDIYLLYFRRIYKHELKRNIKILVARADHECLIRNLDKEVCSYHSENQMWYETEEFGKKGDDLKEAETEYTNSKWPKLESP